MITCKISELDEGVREGMAMVGEDESCKNDLRLFCRVKGRN